MNNNSQPIIQEETLNLLEWDRLCQHLSTFAMTKLGVMASRYLTFPETLEETIDLQQQTKEIYHLEQQLDHGWSFEGITDIGDALERAKLGGLLSGKELLEIATTLTGMKRIRKLIDNLENAPVLKVMVCEVHTDTNLEQDIYHCIDDRAEVADRASTKLSDIRHNLKTLREQIYSKLQNIIQRNSTAVQELVITQRGDRFVLPVKATHKEQINGIVHDISSSGATLYIEPNSIVESGNKLRQLQKQEQREIEIILQKLTDKVSQGYEGLEHLLAVATRLDLATARARYSLWLEANPPHFVHPEEGESITLRKLKHPLLLWQEKHEQGVSVVPIDVTIKPQIRVVAITGPNTGGKTVTLKTMGLCCLMAKVGLFIPAREPVEIPWFSQILADIGDEQSLQQSLSTFSGHIKRVSRIISALETEQHPALILLDEVGAGTDPAEGSALAIALLKYLADHGLLTIATTHYGELKALKYQDSRFENASVEFNDQSLQPTYRLLWGIPGRSNALSIAQRLGLKQEIVSLAQEGLGSNSEDVNLVISALEAQRREQEEKSKQAQSLLQQTEKFYAEVSRKAESLQAREKDLKLSQEREIQQAILEAKQEIAKVIRQLQKGNQTAQNAQKATTGLNEIAEKHLTPLKPAKNKKPYYPKVGEKVKIPRLGQTAEVLSVDSGEVLNVRFGMMKMTVAIADIESLQGEKVEVLVKTKPVTPPPVTPIKPEPVLTVRTSQNSLDIRGSRVMQAESDIDRAITKAISAGSQVLWIVHGKGTGKLREGVHEFLQSHPQVDRFEMAPQNEGGSGVTVAYLK